MLLAVAPALVLIPFVSQRYTYRITATVETQGEARMLDQNGRTRNLRKDPQLAAGCRSRREPFSGNATSFRQTLPRT
jgi:hypothetical protein